MDKVRKKRLERLANELVTLSMHQDTKPLRGEDRRAVITRLDEISTELEKLAASMWHL